MNVTADSKEVTISKEHDEYKWFKKDEVKELYDNSQLTKAAMNSFKGYF